MARNNITLSILLLLLTLSISSALQPQGLVQLNKPQSTYPQQVLYLTGNLTNHSQLLGLNGCGPGSDCWHLSATLYGLVYNYSTIDQAYTNNKLTSYYDKTFINAMNNTWATTYNSSYDSLNYNQTTPFTTWLSTFLYNYNQTAYSGNISGVGTNHYIPMFISGRLINNSLIYQNSESIGIKDTTSDATLNIGTNSSAATVIGNGTLDSSVSLYLHNNNNNYGLLFGSLSNGKHFMQVQRIDGGGSVYDLLLQPNGGNVGIGQNTSASKRLDVNGDAQINSTFYVLNNGNIGLGYSAPSEKVEIHKGNLRLGGNAEGTPYGVLFTPEDSGSWMWLADLNGTSDGLQWGTGTTIDTNSKGIFDTNGRLGIGTTVPNVSLDIIGAGRFNNVITIGQSNSVASERFNLYYNGTGFARTNLQAVPLTGVSIGTDGLPDRFVFAPTGNFGINISNPTEKLYILGSGAQRIIINDSTGLGIARMMVSGTGSYYGGGSGTATYLQSNSTDRMYISTNGQIGINTTNPTGMLTINGQKLYDDVVPGTGTGNIHLKPTEAYENQSTAITFGAGDTGSGSTAQAGIYAQYGSSFGTRLYFATTNAYGTGAKTAMMIDNLGRVGIKTNRPITPLDVNATMRILPNMTTATSCSPSTEGMIYYDGSTHKHYGCNSTTWVEFY